MNPLAPSLAALAVSTIFCLAQQYYRTRRRNESKLRERVAYMLWTAATRQG